MPSIFKWVWSKLWVFCAKFMQATWTCILLYDFCWVYAADNAELYANIIQELCWFQVWFYHDAITGTALLCSFYAICLHIFICADWQESECWSSRYLPLTEYSRPETRNFKFLEVTSSESTELNSLYSSLSESLAAVTVAAVPGPVLVVTVSDSPAAQSQSCQCKFHLNFKLSFSFESRRVSGAAIFSWVPQYIVSPGHWHLPSHSGNVTIGPGRKLPRPEPGTTRGPHRGSRRRRTPRFLAWVITQSKWPQSCQGSNTPKRDETAVDLKQDIGAVLGNSNTDKLRVCECRTMK
jgi:hypothetical protein